MSVFTRRRFLTGLAAGTLGGAGLLTYASAYEAGYALELTSYRPTPPLWPADLQLKIAVIADIHACYPWMPEERIADIVALANAQKPDLTVLLGDFVCTHRFVNGYVPPGAWAEQLARLQAPLGVYSILGNHDWFSAAIPTEPPDDSASVRRALAQARIPILENQSIRLWQGQHPFWLIGLGDQLAHPRGGRAGMFRVDDLPAALRVLDDRAPAILLAHEPYVFPRVPDRVALTLSGHMHGGQINLPLLGSPFLRGGPRYTKHIYGVYQEDRRTLIVSGGLGTSVVPLRVLSPPEVVIVELGGAAAT
jgi:predicted MPP superfamily phosphohydrolase